MSSNRARKFRRPAGDNDDDQATGGDTVSTTHPVKPPSKLLSNTDAKPKKPQAAKLLSFADEEDEAPWRSDESSFRLAKPSSSSHKMTSLKDRIGHSSSAAAASVPSNVQPQAGTYAKEVIRELQKNTRTLASSSGPSSDSKPSSGLNSEPAELVKEAPKVDSGYDQYELDYFQSVEDDAQDKLASIRLTKGKNSSRSTFPDDENITNIGEFDDINDVEEEEMWEEVQLRKGLGKIMDERSNASNDVPVAQQKCNPSAATVNSIGGTIGTSLGLSQQAEIANKALQDNVRRLKV